jgi:hypothetical protein
MALNALRDVPVGFTMADGENAGGVHGVIVVELWPRPAPNKTRLPQKARRRVVGAVGRISNPQDPWYRIRREANAASIARI